MHGNFELDTIKKRESMIYDKIRTVELEKIHLFKHFCLFLIKLMS